MAIQEMELDPNAQAYTDDEIVGKVNAATAKVTRADAIEPTALEESAAFQKLTQTKEDKLDGIAAGAEVNPADLAELDSSQDDKLNAIEANATADQTGNEIVTAIDAGSSSITREDAIDADSMDIVKTDPQAGEFKVKSIQRKVSGKLGTKYDDVAV